MQPPSSSFLRLVPIVVGFMAVVLCELPSLNATDTQVTNRYAAHQCRLSVSALAPGLGLSSCCALVALLLTPRYCLDVLLCYRLCRYGLETSCVAIIHRSASHVEILHGCCKLRICNLVDIKL